MKLYDILFEDHRQGDIFGSFLIDNPTKAKELLSAKLNIKNSKTVDALLEKIFDSMKKDKSFIQAISQIFAVIDGKKPMWFGASRVLRKLGKSFLSKLESVGLKSYSLGRHGLLGKPENVDIAAKQLEKHHGDIPVADKEFHRTMGLALGYPEADVEKFVSML